MYVREIARTTKGNINTIRRELTNLEGIGLLKSERRSLPVNNRNYDIRYCQRNIKEGCREGYGKSGEIS